MSPDTTTIWRPNESSLTRDSFNALVRRQKCDVSMVLQRDGKLSQRRMLAAPKVGCKTHWSMLEQLPPSPRDASLHRSASVGSPMRQSQSLSLCSSKLDGPGSIRLGTPTAAEAAAAVERTAKVREQFSGLTRPTDRLQHSAARSSSTPSLDRPRPSRGGSFLPPKAGRLHRVARQEHSSSVVAGLSPDFAALVQGVFAKMDENGDGSITKAEAKAFFNRFSGISANAMFQAVDEDHDDTITQDEFLAFWTSVKRNGYSESDLREELDELMAGNAWISFDVEGLDSYGSGA